MQSDLVFLASMFVANEVKITTVREYVFYVFFENPKNATFTFFEVAFQKNVKKRNTKISSFRIHTT